MLPRCSSALRRGTVVAVLTGGLLGFGAPAATAVEDAASGLALGGVPATAGPGTGDGWIEDVRAASAESTAAVAGGAVLLVAGAITAVAVRPRRTPPAEG